MEITDWLKFRQNLGISLYNNDRGTYYNRETGEGKSANGRAGRSDNFGQNLTAESLLTFDKTFNDIHKLNVVAGFTYEKSSWGGKSITASNFTTDLTQDFDMSQALNVDRPTSNRGEAVLVSLYEYAIQSENEKLCGKIKEVFDLQFDDLPNRFRRLGLDDSLVCPSYVINTSFLQEKIKRTRDENPELRYHEDNEEYLIRKTKKQYTLSIRWRNGRHVKINF